MAVWSQKLGDHVIICNDGTTWTYWPEKKHEDGRVTPDLWKRLCDLPLWEDCA